MKTTDLLIAALSLFSDMSDSKGKSVIALFVSVIYRLTVRLTVELLKFGLVAVILLGVSALIGLGFVVFVYGAYTRYDSSILAAVCAAVFGLVLVLLVAVVVEFVIKDVMRLTDMPLIDILKLVFKGMIVSRSASRKPAEQNSSGSSLSDQQVKKTT